MTATALFLDVDGTLLEFAPHPDAVMVKSNLIELLASLHSKLGGALALISGRTIQKLDQLFAPYRFPAAGLHGIERRITANDDVVRLNVPLLPEPLKVAIKQVIAKYSSAFLEDKGYSAAIHHRLMKDGTTILLRDLKAVCAPYEPEWDILRGRQVLEIKPSVGTKGNGCHFLLMHKPFTHKRIIAFGDDITDLDMFNEIKSHHGITVSVGPRIANADYRLASPGQAINVLRHLHRALKDGNNVVAALASAVLSTKSPLPGQMD